VLLLGECLFWGGGGLHSVVVHGGALSVLLWPLYEIVNVARCWTYETAVLLGEWFGCVEWGGGGLLLCGVWGYEVYCHVCFRALIGVG
jgi:hypothetical protein